MLFRHVLYQLSYIRILVYRVGIEPTTYGLRVRRSTAELPVHYLEDTLQRIRTVPPFIPQKPSTDAWVPTSASSK